MHKTTPLPFWLGLLCWLIFSVLHFPQSPFALHYVYILLLAVPFCLVPLGWAMLGYSKTILWIGWCAAISLSIAYSLPQGMLAALLAIPWLALNGFLAIRRLFRSFSLHTASLCQLAALIFISVGAFWAVMDRLDYSPMNFSSIIVLLTAVHFHYAGFVLPLATSWVLPKVDTKLGQWAAWGVLAGMPLVAIGITGEHIGLPPWIEALSVSVMAGAGILTGYLHLHLGWKNRNTFYGRLWCLGGIAIILGMSLGLAYGWRSFYPSAFLSIPSMYALHGSLNAIGFGAPVFIAWWNYELAKKLKIYPHDSQN